MSGANNESLKLPSGWLWVTLDDIGDVLLGKTPNKNDYRNDGQYKIIKYRDLVAGKIIWSNSEKGFVVESDTVLAQCKELNTKDVLVGASAHSSEHIGRKISFIENIPADYRKVFFVGELLCIRADSNISDPRLIYYFLSSDNAYKSIQAHVRGVHLISSEAKIINILLPPINEQYRIVAKIEELITNLDAGVEALKKVQVQIKRYRQAVLKYAFEGKLTAKWREAHKDELEPASVFLEWIREEHKKKMGGKYKEPPAVDTSDLPSLPNKWEWTNMGGLTDLTSGIAFKKSEYSDSGARLFQIANVSFGEVIWDTTAYLPEEYFDKYPALLLKEGDIVMALNRPILDGKLKVGVLEKRDAPAILYQRVGRFDLFDSSISRFIFWYLQTPFFIDSLRFYLQGVDQPFVTKPKLLSIVIPFPSLKEQNEIVEVIERRISLIDHIEKAIEQGYKQSDRLRQSILKKAFEGKLVPQDPNDEPADKLLERIKEARANQAAESKKVKSKKGS